MLRFLGALLGLTLLALSGAVQAAPTVFSTDCTANAVVSNGGLTVTMSSGSRGGCRATNAMYAGIGKGYFEFTTGAVNTLGVGVANNAPSQPVVGGYDLLSSIGGDQTMTSAGVDCGALHVRWMNTNGGAVTCVASKTGAFVLDQVSSSSVQMWLTPDVTNHICDGAGHTGATNPQWNGNCANDPSLPGTGGVNICCLPQPGIWLRGASYYPAINAGTNGNSATFNFGASAFVGTVPAGFSSWDVATASGPPNPGPSNSLQIDIANAPAWQSSHIYVLGDRVVAGPGWSSGSYVNGSPLYLWALVSGGGGSSASSGNGPQSCPSPAGTGGITFSPLEWSTASQAVDGALTWACLTQVDYVTQTGAYQDEPTVWAPSTVFHLSQYVRNTVGGVVRMYRVTTASTGFVCTSGTGVGPIGTTMGATTVDGNCTWSAQGPLTYSSNLKVWPHMLTMPSGQPEQQYNFYVNIRLWYGGKEQQVYQPGQNGESLPLLMNSHADLISDAIVSCYKADFANTAPTSFSCNGKEGWQTSLSPAPGDSWAENVSPATQPLRIDASKGVALFQNSNYSAPSNFYVSTGESLALSDSGVTITGMQWQSTNSNCLNASNQVGPGSSHVNVILVIRNIFDCGGTSPAAINLDGATMVRDSVIIWRSTVAQGTAAYFKYPAHFIGNTVVCVGGTNLTAMQQGLFGSVGSFIPTVVRNNLIIGCAGWADPTVTQWPSFNAGGSATSVAPGLSGTFTSAINGQNWTLHDYQGVGPTCGIGNSSTCFSLTPSTIFVNPTIGSLIDLRLLSANNPVYGAGINFSVNLSTSVFGVLTPGTDIFNITRGARIDAGAAQAQTAPTIASGGRLRL